MIVGYRFMVIKITPRDTLKNLLLCNNYNNYWRKHVVIFCKIFLVVDFVMNWELPSLLVEYKTEFVPSKIVVRDNYCGWSSFVFVSFFFSFPERQETPHVIPSLARSGENISCMCRGLIFFHGFNFICLCRWLWYCASKAQNLRLFSDLKSWAVLS